MTAYEFHNPPRRQLPDEAAQAVMRQHPEIGVLQLADGPLYYVWPVGGQYRTSNDPAALVPHTAAGRPPANHPESEA